MRVDSDYRCPITGAPVVTYAAGEHSISEITLSVYHLALDEVP